VCAFIGYLIESIFGFGGTISFLSTSGLFFDFKLLIHLSIYMGIVFSGTIIIQNWHYIEWNHVKKLTLYCLPGYIIGTYLMDVLPSETLLKIFAIFLIAYGLQNILAPNFHPPSFLKKFFVIVGGFIQGLTTTGAPFVIMGCRDEFKDKTSLRASMALFFCIGNIYRFIQNSLTSGSALQATIEYWWICFPLILSAIVGYAIHKKIPEQIFKKLIIILLTLIGIIFLFR
jgi:uncharacterized membrane protein YfcA